MQHWKMVVGVVAVLAMSATLVGCGNKCKEATDKTMGCIEDYCADHATEKLCTRIEQVRTNLTTADEGECTDALATEAQEALDMECPAILSRLGVTAPTGDDSN